MGSSAAEVERILQAARVCLAKSEFHEAIEQASEAIRRDNKQPAVYLVRAEAHRKLKRPDRALADLAVAIRLDPNQPGPYVIRAEILKRRNMFDQAIADASHAIIMDARSAAAYSIRAECRSAIGDHEGAIEDVQEMVRLDPTRPIPDLRDRSVSGDPNPATELEDERFWKQSGGKASNDTTVFADGKPVDKTYRSSRRVVSDDDAPEALGVASGYKLGAIPKPIPRLHSERKRPSGTPVLVALGCLALLGCGYVLISQNHNPQVANTLQGQAEPRKATSQPVTPAANENHSVVALLSAAPATSIPDSKPLDPPGIPVTTNLNPTTPSATPDEAAHVRAEIDPTERDMKALEGEWLCVAMEEIGNTLNRKAVKEQDRRVTIRGHSYTMKRTENGNRHTLVGKFEIDASNGHFDFVGREQGGQSTVWIGIYALKDDTLKLCYRYKRNEDALRPTRFETDTEKPNVAVCYTFTRDSDSPAMFSPRSSSPVGKWIELRPGTPVGDRVRTFLADGTLITQYPKDQSTTVGTWRKEGEKVFLKQSTQEAEGRWFTISAKDEKTMTILMMGERKYVWYKSS